MSEDLARFTSLENADTTLMNLITTTEMGVYPPADTKLAAEPFVPILDMNDSVSVTPKITPAQHENIKFESEIATLLHEGKHIPFRYAWRYGIVIGIDYIEKNNKMNVPAAGAYVIKINKPFPCLFFSFGVHGFFIKDEYENQPYCPVAVTWPTTTLISAEERVMLGSFMQSMDFMGEHGLRADWWFIDAVNSEAVLIQSPSESEIQNALRTTKQKIETWKKEQKAKIHPRHKSLDPKFCQLQRERTWAIQDFMLEQAVYAKQLTSMINQQYNTKYVLSSHYPWLNSEPIFANCKLSDFVNLGPFFGGVGHENLCLSIEEPSLVKKTTDAGLYEKMQAAEGGKKGQTKRKQKKGSKSKTANATKIYYDKQAKKRLDKIKKEATRDKRTRTLAEELCKTQKTQTALKSAAKDDQKVKENENQKDKENDKEYEKEMKDLFGEDEHDEETLHPAVVCAAVGDDEDENEIHPAQLDEEDEKDVFEVDDEDQDFYKEDEPENDNADMNVIESVMEDMEREDTMNGATKEMDEEDSKSNEGEGAGSFSPSVGQKRKRKTTVGTRKLKTHHHKEGVEKPKRKRQKK